MHKFINNKKYTNKNKNKLPKHKPDSSVKGGEALPEIRFGKDAEQIAHKYCWVECKLIKPLWEQNEAKYDFSLR